jgi:hypothetical protein
MNTAIDIDALITDADSEFPALFQFFGGYFNQDWRTEYETPVDAINAYVADAPPEAVSEAATEIDRVLSLELDEAALARLLREGFDCNYVPELDDGLVSDWLLHVRDDLRRGIAETPRH